jgi:hypothetical protein
MGLVAECTGTVDGRAFNGRAQLEPTELRLDGPAPTRVPLTQISRVEARSGRLTVEHRGGVIELALGKAAEAWALKILYPRGRTEKLGVKPGHRISVQGLADAGFVEELEKAGGKVAVRGGRGPYDMVIVKMTAKADLPRLDAARRTIVPNGMIWAVWPKGRKEFREDDIRAYGPEVGLVDVKVMSFSDELSGLKLVVPVSQR